MRETAIAFAARLVRCDDDISRREQELRCQAAKRLRDLHVANQKLQKLLADILHDATGDVNDQQKRLWPIRAANYRRAAELLDATVATERGE